MKRISVCGKGGSGKSTIVALLPEEFARRDQRVVVVDSDESNACLYWTLGFEQPPHPLLELIGGKKNVQQQMRKTFSEGNDADTAVLSRPEPSVKDLPADYVVDDFAGDEAMCLVTIYLQHSDGSVAAEPAFEGVARLECKEGEVVITSLLGAPQTVRGRVRSADLLDSTVIIETNTGQTSAR